MRNRQKHAELPISCAARKRSRVLEGRGRWRGECISHFPLPCLVKRELTDVQSVSVSGDLYNFSSLSVFLPHWTPKETHGKQNAPSRYLEYANQGNLFSRLH